MKIKLILRNLVMLTTIFVVLFIVTTKINSSNELVVNVATHKSTYLLGEIVSLGIDINNQTESDIYLSGTDVKSGYVEIFVSADGKRYKKYSNASWGSKKSRGRVIKPGQSISTSADILSNAVPDLTNLSRTSVRAFEEKQLTTVYAFPNAGNYYVKAVLNIPSKEGKKIESDPVQIVIEEPKGDDLKIWNKIKDRADFAYFLQEGEFVDFKNAEERSKFAQEVEEIINRFPDNIYTESLRQSLNKFNASEEKRKIQMQKLQ